MPNAQSSAKGVLLEDLTWIEAEQALRPNSVIVKTQRVVAIKAVAHKLARACYYVLRDQVPFEVNKAFA